MMGPAPRRTTRLSAFALSLALIGGTILTTTPAIAAGRVYSGCFGSDILAYVRVNGSVGCGSFGTKVTWHEAGPTGATGAAGPAGPRGAKGIRGPKGLKGKPGRNGVNGVDGVDGQDGVDGARGATGARGPRGPMAKLVTYAVSASTSGTDGRLMTVSASCDAGDLAVGGGFETDGTILASLGQGAPSPTRWQAIALSSVDEPSELRVQVICADLGAKHRKAGS